MTTLVVLLCDARDERIHLSDYVHADRMVCEAELVAINLDL